MKRFLLILLVISSVLLLTGCCKDGNSLFGLVILSNPDANTYICYDKKTNVVYYCYRSTYLASMTEYYIINKDGKPEIAIYEVNYLTQ